MTALALLGFLTANQFWMLLLWAIPYGLGAGAVDAALTGSTLAPPIFGFLGAAACMWLLPLFLGMLVVLGLVMSERLNRMAPA